jgi:hypothetical protein
MRMPQFSAEASLPPRADAYQAAQMFDPSLAANRVEPQKPHFWGVCLGRWLGCYGVWLDY